jgi:hypothetical protein
MAAVDHQPRAPASAAAEPDAKQSNAPVVMRRLPRHTIYKVGASEFEVHHCCGGLTFCRAIFIAPALFALGSPFSNVPMF